MLSNQLNFVFLQFKKIAVVVKKQWFKLVFYGAVNLIP